MQAIAAVDRNWAIGNKGSLLVSIPNDHKMFRKITQGKILIYGRKTLETFPMQHPLEGRRNIILSSNRSLEVKGAEVVHSIDELLELVRERQAVIPSDDRDQNRVKKEPGSGLLNEKLQLSGVEPDSGKWTDPEKEPGQEEKEPGQEEKKQGQEKRDGFGGPGSDDFMVIGGASVYKELLPYCDTAYITKIDYEYEADAYFPNLDRDSAWELSEEGDEQTYFDVPYTFTKYIRTGR